MSLLFRIQAALAACFFALAAQAQIHLHTGGAVVTTDQVRAELLVHAPQGVAPGSAVWVGLQLKHQPHWHTYWKNPGDSGLATQLQWSLPAGVTAGEIAWPVPRKIKIGTLANFGYEDTVLLPVPLTIGPQFQPSGATGELEVKLNATWLVCKQECIPQDGSFTLKIPTRSSMAANGAAFDAALASAATPHSGQASARIAGNALQLQVAGLPADWAGRALLALPELAEVAESNQVPNPADAVGAAAQAGTQAWKDGLWTASMPLSAQRSASPKVLPLLLSDGSKSLHLEVAVEGSWPATAAGAPDAAAATPAAAPADLLSWALALGAALVGGMILNLMPCVFPVLAIKVLAFAQHADAPKSAQRLQGIAYTVGVVGSFVALGALMLALRAGGEQLGWGFQLQSPGVITVLAVLFTLIGLNLVGLLDVGNLLPTGLASMQLRHPLADAFLSGVLAVAIASPCTAPFMGASLGYAIALPAAQALAVFAALGLGLALPYLLASYLPAIGRLLPRPGAWMEQLRNFMAFPMWATVVWLLWVLGHLSGVDGAATLLALLVLLATLVWSLNQTGRARWVFSAIAVAASAVLLNASGASIFKQESAAGAEAGPWQPWTVDKVQAELAQGKPVFVDFTAAWCITCQYNKKTTLAASEVVADFAAKKVTLLRADWTRRDPAITQALTQLGRSGVPVYVLYRNGKAPLVFSEVLSQSALREAIAAL